jgi:hypothetical protein
VRQRAPAVLLACAALACAALGCATREPVLYPNDHLRSVGAEGARADVAECRERARAYVKTGVLAEPAKHAAAGAIVGGAAGAAGGAVFGRAGRGAAAGAAGGATAALVRLALFRRGPEPLERRFVERCLRERGYDPIGWR